MKARHQSRCPLCGGWVHIGQLIVLPPDRWDWSHAGCYVDWKAGRLVAWAEQVLR